MDTIFALATAPGKAGVAVVRVSGPNAVAAALVIAGGCPIAHRTSLRALRDTSGEMIDQGVVVYFPRGASFTGEDVVEFQTHGSTAVISRLLAVLSNIAGVRLADPGEFTRRALENGQLDLAQVEGLADLVEAETEAQRQQALRVFSGALSKRSERWRADLIRAVALLEATIDFADEDVPIDVTPEVTELIRKVLGELKQEAKASFVAERIRDGFEVAIVGPPNAGKSTLLNALAGRDAAITSEIAGTTRDVIEVRMDLGGVPVTLLDTAGIRETADIVEKMGVDRALDRARAADIRVFLLSNLDDHPVGLTVGIDDLVLRSKVDQDDGQPGGISGLTLNGVDALTTHLQSRLTNRALSAGIATRERHRIAILRACDPLELAIPMIASGPELTELVSEEIQTSVRALDSLIGRVDVEMILDEIFSSFCLGK